MHLPDSLTVPHWRDIARHAVPNVIEGKLIPAGIFIAVLQLGGTQPAVLGALAWALLAIAVRSVRRKPISGLLALTTLALIGRTIAALATGSTIVYFLQPTITTSLVAAAFLVSVPIGRPLAERLALDFCPLEDSTRANPVVQRFFRDVSLWWAFTSAVNFTVTLWSLLTHSPTTFVMLKSVLGPITTTITLGVAFVWFKVLMNRSGTNVVVATRGAMAVGGPRLSA